jgi:hypothetical protein
VSIKKCLKNDVETEETAFMEKLNMTSENSNIFLILGYVEKNALKLKTIQPS